MNGQFCRVFLFLTLAVLVVCLPAQAAHSGPSLPMSGQTAGISVSSELSADASPESVNTASGINTGNSLSSPSLVQGGDGVMTSGIARDGLVSTGKGTQTGQGNTYIATSPPSDLSADPPGSDLSATGPVDGRREPVSPQESGRETSTRIPDSAGQLKGAGLMAGMMMSHGGAAAARSAYGSESSSLPEPGHGRGPSPQRHQQGPPAHSGSYPCGPAQASPLPPPPGQTRDESKEETPSRQKSKRIGILSGYWTPSVPTLNLPRTLCNRSSPLTCC